MPRHTEGGLGLEGQSHRWEGPEVRGMARLFPDQAGCPTSIPAAPCQTVLIIRSTGMNVVLNNHCLTWGHGKEVARAT